MERRWKKQIYTVILRQYLRQRFAKPWDLKALSLSFWPEIFKREWSIRENVIFCQPLFVHWALVKYAQLCNSLFTRVGREKDWTQFVRNRSSISVLPFSINTYPYISFMRQHRKWSTQSERVSKSHWTLVLRSCSIHSWSLTWRNKVEEMCCSKDVVNIDQYLSVIFKRRVTRE